MSLRSMIVVILALGCGLTTALGIAIFLNFDFSKSGAANETVHLVTLVTDVPRGKTLSEEDLKIQEFPMGTVINGSFGKIEDCVDRTAAIPMLAGEAIIDRKLSSPDGGRGLASLIPLGMRAYTIRTSKASSSVAGFVLPGNRVDILMSLRDGNREETGGGSSVTLLQSVEILAVDQLLDPPSENVNDPKGAQSVTLLVTPDQTSVLDLAQNMGTLSLSLRNLEDKIETDTVPATLKKLRFLQMGISEEPGEDQFASDTITVKKPELKQEPHVYHVRTMRGQHSGSVDVTIWK